MAAADSCLKGVLTPPAKRPPGYAAFSRGCAITHKSGNHGDFRSKPRDPSVLRTIDIVLFGLLGPRCLLDCHVLKGFGIYMIGILDRLY